MKKIVVFIILSVFVLSACRNDPKPKNAVQRDKFVDVLVDLHIAESMFRERHRISLDSLESVPLYMSVLEKHGVTKEEMLLTTLYYSRHQREYERIFSDVLTKISLLIEEETQRKEDARPKELIIQTE